MKRSLLPIMALALAGSGVPELGAASRPDPYPSPDPLPDATRTRLNEERVRRAAEKRARRKAKRRLVAP